jgi:hypothetical protein
MNTQELGEQYQRKTDQELLRLALEPEDLTQEARVALTSELVRRNIDGETSLAGALQEERERKAEEERNIGRLFLFHHLGIGRMRFGKSSRVRDSLTGREQFKTTVFIVFFWFPLVPTGTYVVERRKDMPDKLTGLEKLPLDWEQVLKVWVVAAGSLLALIWLIKLLSSDAFWKLVHHS